MLAYFAHQTRFEKKLTHFQSRDKTKCGSVVSLKMYHLPVQVNTYENKDNLNHRN